METVSDFGLGFQNYLADGADRSSNKDYLKKSYELNQIAYSCRDDYCFTHVRSIKAMNFLWSLKDARELTVGLEAAYSLRIDAFELLRFHFNP